VRLELGRRVSRSRPRRFIRHGHCRVTKSSSHLLRGGQEGMNPFHNVVFGADTATDKNLLPPHLFSVQSTTRNIVLPLPPQHTLESVEIVDARQLYVVTLRYR